MENQIESIDFSKNIRVSAEIQDLENLGWNFERAYEDVLLAYQSAYKSDHGEEDNTYNIERAAEYEYQNYHIVIFVDQNGSAFWSTQSNSRNEISDREWAGEDEKTIEDIVTLHSKGLLWNIENT
jgi:hypothetical protein